MLFLSRFDFALTYRPGSKNFKPDAGCLGLGPEPVAEPEHILAFSCILGVAIWPMEVRVREALRSSPDPSGASPSTLLSVCSEVLQWVQIGVSSRAELHATGTPGTPGVPGCRGWSMPTTPWSQHPLRCCFHGVDHQEEEVPLQAYMETGACRPLMLFPPGPETSELPQSSCTGVATSPES